MDNNHGLRSTYIQIRGKFYRVENYPWEKCNDPESYLKGVAYLYQTDLTNLALPYQGVLDDEDFDNFDFNTAAPGLYMKKIGSDRYKRIIIRPKKEEAAEYNPSKAKDILVATLDYQYDEDQFMDNDLLMSDIGKELYQPPIYSKDDPINMLVKLAIRLKHAPFGPYAKRLEALAVDKRGNERNNNKNNLRRRHRENNAMSAYMMLNDTNIWQLETALIIRDCPNAMHKMDGVPEGSLLVIYPNGIPFDIDPSKIVDVTDLVSQAIAETDKESGGRKKTGKKKKKRGEDEFSITDMDDEDEDSEEE